MPVARLIALTTLALASVVFLGPLIVAAAVVAGAVPGTGGAGLASSALSKLTSGEAFPAGAGITSTLISGAILAIGIAAAKTVLALLAAYALAVFRFRLAPVVLGAIVATLLLPIEVRMAGTRDMAVTLGLGGSYGGLVVPLGVSAIATIVFYGEFRSLSRDMIAAARLDGAGPLRLLFDFVLPAAWPTIAGLFALMLIVGWNQYLWPLLATTTPAHFTALRALAEATATGGTAATGAIGALALYGIVPPLLVAVFCRHPLMRAIAALTGVRHDR